MSLAQRMQYEGDGQHAYTIADKSSNLDPEIRSDFEALPTALCAHFLDPVAGEEQKKIMHFIIFKTEFAKTASGQKRNYDLKAELISKFDGLDEHTAQAAIDFTLKTQARLNANIAAALRPS